MIINDLDGYYIVFDTKNWNTELDTLFLRSVELAGDQLSLCPNPLQVESGSVLWIHEIPENAKAWPLLPHERLRICGGVGWKESCLEGTGDSVGEGHARLLWWQIGNRWLLWWLRGGCGHWFSLQLRSKGSHSYHQQVALYLSCWFQWLWTYGRGGWRASSGWTAQAGVCSWFIWTVSQVRGR